MKKTKKNAIHKKVIGGVKKSKKEWETKKSEIGSKKINRKKK